MQHMAFIGMASGWFGRLRITMSEDFGFTELMDLFALAQQACTRLS